LFQGVGARIPQDVADPLVEVVWPLWTGRSPLPPWWTGERFTRNLARLGARLLVGRLTVEWQWVQFLPLVAFQAAGVAYLFKTDGDSAPGASS